MSNRDNAQAVRYTQELTGSQYDFSSGIMALPLAELVNNKALELVRLHQPFRTRTVPFEYVKENAPPLVPSPSDTTKDTFLGGSLILPLPQMTNNKSSYRFAVQGEYKFIETDQNFNLNYGFRVGDFPTITPPQFSFLISSIGNPQNPNLVGEAYAQTFDKNDQSADYMDPTHFPATYLSTDLVEGA